MTKILIFLFIISVLSINFYFLFHNKLLSKFMGIKTETKSKIASEEGISEISILALYDNYLSSETFIKEKQANAGLKTGWGFSCLIKTTRQNILFDTGADSETLLSNMEKMEIDPKAIDIIVLSHIHGDHTGGLEGILKENGSITVYIPISFPDSLREMITSYGGKFIDVTEIINVSKDIYSTGELGTWIKEQSLIINSKKGLIVITGCAHPGVVNIIKKVKEIFSEEDIYLVLGGFHLGGASDTELKSIINDFRKLDVQKVAPCHCSGDRCRELFKEEYQKDFIENGVGKIIEV